MSNQEELILTPTDFVAITNQSLEYTFGLVRIQGELSNFRVSKKRWVYFDLKDEFAKIACFASVYNLPGPLQDGMMLVVSGQPRLHPQFGFSINVQTISPIGEGSIKKAYEMLKAKLQAEGLFDEDRKRLLPYPPHKIALITSTESAAYADFTKVLAARWPFVKLEVYNVQVQGEQAPAQLVEAILGVNNEAELADVMVITRGGGSGDDLAAFDDERVVRAISSSRVTSLVAIGHEIDYSLSELAADKRASTPSNAAELIAPDKKSEATTLKILDSRLKSGLMAILKSELVVLANSRLLLKTKLAAMLNHLENEINNARGLLCAFNPNQILKRGYAIIKRSNMVISSVYQIQLQDDLSAILYDGEIDIKVINVKNNRKVKS